MAEINSFPNNSDVYIGAEEVMKWLHGRTKGVFAGVGNAAVSAVPSSMQVSVAAGIGWITDADGDGVCWWFDSAITLDIDAAESTGTLNRIDRVIIEWQTTDYAAVPEVKVLKGTNASSAVAPALTNNSSLRQISLAKVSIPAGTTELTNALITDERQDPDVCGIVTETVTADTSVIQAQFEAIYAQVTAECASILESIEQELEDLQAEAAVELKKLQFDDTVVATTAFISDATYTDYPYRAAIALTDVIANMIPDVMFDMAEAISGVFAPVAKCYNGGVYIYANGVPDSAITIPTIICWRSNA